MSIEGVKETPSVEYNLLKGTFPELSKMKKAELLVETEMWRNVWSWMPSEVKYYVARTGKTVALTGRNYKRHLGVLLETHWDITEIELGVYEKEYDSLTGKHFYERKIIRTKLGGIIDIQWIDSREAEEDVLAEAEGEPSPTIPSLEQEEEPQ